MTKLEVAAMNEQHEATEAQLGELTEELLDPVVGGTDWLPFAALQQQMASTVAGLAATGGNTATRIG